MRARPAPPPPTPTRREHTLRYLSHGWSRFDAALVGYNLFATALLIGGEVNGWDVGVWTVTGTLLRLSRAMRVLRAVALTRTVRTADMMACGQLQWVGHYGFVLRSLVCALLLLLWNKWLEKCAQ